MFCAALTIIRVICNFLVILDDLLIIDVLLLIVVLIFLLVLFIIVINLLVLVVIIINLLMPSLSSTSLSLSWLFTLMVLKGYWGSSTHGDSALNIHWHCHKPRQQNDHFTTTSTASFGK